MPKFRLTKSKILNFHIDNVERTFTCPVGAVIEISEDNLKKAKGDYKHLKAYTHKDVKTLVPAAANANVWKAVEQYGRWVLVDPKKHKAEPDAEQTE